MLRTEPSSDESINTEYEAIKKYFEEFYKNKPEIIKEFETFGFEVTCAEAQFFLGLLYDSADFRNEAKAMEFFKKAAEQKSDRSEYAKELYIKCQQKQYLDTGRIVFDTLQESSIDLESKNIISDIVQPLPNIGAKTFSLFENSLSDKNMGIKYFVPMFKTSEAHQLSIVNKNLHFLFKDSLQTVREKLEKLLRCVSMGYQDAAEMMIRKNLNLLMMKGKFTDPFGRNFKSISAFQYAVWAHDYYMWRMIKKYLSHETALMQFDELETKGTEHGKCFDFSPLINAMKFFIKNFHGWFKRKDIEGCTNHLVGVIGGAQRHSIAHLLNEYHDDEFTPLLRVKWKELSRHLHSPQSISHLLLIPLVQNRGLGVQFCLLRSASPRVLGGRRALVDLDWHTDIENSTLLEIVKDDLAAIISLRDRRARDKAFLKRTLYKTNPEKASANSKCLIM